MLLLIAYICGLLTAMLGSVVPPCYLLVKMALETAHSNTRIILAIIAIGHITAVLVVIQVFQSASVELLPGMWLLGAMTLAHLVETAALLVYRARKRHASQLITASH